MGIRAHLWRQLARTLAVCALLRVLPASCNISRISLVHGPSGPLKTHTPRVCIPESPFLGVNTPRPAFVASRHPLGRTKCSLLDLPRLEGCAELAESAVSAGGRLEPVHMKRPASEAQVSSLVKNQPTLSLFSGDFFGSRLRLLRDSAANLTRDDVFSAANKLGLFGLWYFAGFVQNRENLKLLEMVPLPRTVAALQLLGSVPFTTMRWLVGLDQAPKLNPPQYQLEKVDFSREGLFKSLKRSVRNGLARTRAYVKAYKSVLLQGALASLPHVLSSFTSGLSTGLYLVKALEPALVALFARLLEGLKMPNKAYLSLLPVVTGLVYMKSTLFSSFSALLNNLSDSPVMDNFYTLDLKRLGHVGRWASALLPSALGSLKRLESRRFFGQNLERLGKGLTRANMNKLVNLASTFMLVPLALLEKGQWSEAFATLSKRSVDTHLEFLTHLVLASFSHALVNQLSFKLLSQLSPVGQALASSLKNVFAMLANSALFGRSLTRNELYGSALALAGVLLYSLATST